MEAARAGRVHYLRAKACPACGNRVYYTSTGKCVQCTNERAVAWQRKIRDTLREAKAGTAAG